MTTTTPESLAADRTRTAADLNAAADYLDNGGWCQGTMFVEGLTRAATLEGEYVEIKPGAACAAGALKIVVDLDGKVPAKWHDVEWYDNPSPRLVEAEIALVEYLVGEDAITRPHLSDPDSADPQYVLTVQHEDHCAAITNWNDDNDRTSGEVVAALRGAASTVLAGSPA